MARDWIFKKNGAEPGARANDPICHGLCSEPHRPRQTGSRLILNVLQEMIPSYDSLAKDEHGLPLVFEKIPDTSVARFMRGFDNLQGSEKRAVVDQLTQYAQENLQSALMPSRFERPKNFDEIYNITHSIPPRLKGETSLKTLSQLVGMMKSDKPGARRMLGDMKPDPDLIEYMGGLDIVKAVDLRKELKFRFKESFDLTAECRGSGIWLYSSPKRDLGIEVDYGGSWGQQLRYSLVHPLLRRASLEIMWGVGVGDWDYIHRDNLEQSISALFEIYSFYETILAEQAGAYNP